MVKILSQTGMSLADIYDVVGSVAGVEQLESREVTLLHEMGATIFSERYSQFIRAGSSGAIAQSVNFNVVLNDLPSFPFRILGVSVFADAAARVALASVALRSASNDREIPIWIYDFNVDVEVLVRHSLDGAAVVNTTFLRPTQLLEAIPAMAAGLTQPQRVNEIAFRGQAIAFGAGTVTVRMLLHLGFGQVGGISSRGLPIPSW